MPMSPGRYEKGRGLRLQDPAFCIVRYGLQHVRAVSVLLAQLLEDAAQDLFPRTTAGGGGGGWGEQGVREGSKWSHDIYSINVMSMNESYRHLRYKYNFIFRYETCGM